MIEPKEILYGERYADDSGYEWSVKLDRETYTGPRLVITGCGGDVDFDIYSVSVRKIAKALDLVADLLGEDKLADPRSNG
jgi:hypothetical protein